MAKIDFTRGRCGGAIFNNQISEVDNGVVNDGETQIDLTISLTANSACLICAELSGYFESIDEIVNGADCASAKLVIDSVIKTENWLLISYDGNVTGGIFFSCSLSHALNLSAGTHLIEIIMYFPVDHGSNYLKNASISALAVQPPF